MLDNSYRSAIVTVDVASVSICVLARLANVSAAKVAVGIAIRGELVLHLTNESATLYVTNSVAVVVVLMLSLTNVSAIYNVAGSVASVIKLVLGCSGITALIALDVAITGEYVNALPNGNEINRSGNNSIEIPIASVGKSPTDELVSAPYRSLGFCYRAADLNVDVRNIITVCRIKRNSYKSRLLEPRKITSYSCHTENGNQTK